MKVHLSEILVKENEIEKYIEKCSNIIKDKEKIIIFGVGSGGINTYNFLKKNNYKGTITYFCDNDPSNWEKDLFGIKVLSPKKMREAYSGEYIIITCAAVNDVKNQLNEIGIRNSEIGVFDFIFLNSENADFQFIQEKMSYFNKVYQLLEDDKSKNVFSGVLNYKISHDTKYLEYIADCEGDMYFDKDIIKVKGNDVYVDVGGYKGDTLEKFIAFCKEKYSKCICIEPKINNFDLILESIKNNDLKNVEAHCLGAWSERTTLRFNVRGSGSGFIDNSGLEVINVDTLDNIVNNSRVDFIKMDVVGSEYQAILGAKEIIKKYTPILAVAVSYQKDDFFKIPLLISKITPAYKLYFRHYSKFSEYSTVCYAIPRL